MDLEEDVRAQLVAKYMAYAKKKDRGKDDSTLVKEGISYFREMWTADCRLNVVPGKKFISRLSFSLQEKYGVSITLTQLISEMRRDEVSEELKAIISNMECYFSFD